MGGRQCSARSFLARRVTRFPVLAGLFAHSLRSLPPPEAPTNGKQGRQIRTLRRETGGGIVRLHARLWTGRQGPVWNGCPNSGNGTYVRTFRTQCLHLTGLSTFDPRHHCLVIPGPERFGHRPGPGTSQVVLPPTLRESESPILKPRGPWATGEPPPWDPQASSCTPIYRRFPVPA